EHGGILEGTGSEGTGYRGPSEGIGSRVSGIRYREERDQGPGTSEGIGYRVSGIAKKGIRDRGPRKVSGIGYQVARRKGSGTGEVHQAYRLRDGNLLLEVCEVALSQRDFDTRAFGDLVAIGVGRRNLMDLRALERHQQAVAFFIDIDAAACRDHQR